jgi:hypothetical protein
MDRQKSKDAIQEKIDEEKARIKKLKERRAKRKKDGRDTSDLDRDIEDEEMSIRGKEEILEYVDGFARAVTIDKAIKAEEDLYWTACDEWSGRYVSSKRLLMPSWPGGVA